MASGDDSDLCLLVQMKSITTCRGSRMSEAGALTVLDEEVAALKEFVIGSILVGEESEHDGPVE